MLTLADLIIALKNRLQTAVEQGDLKASSELRMTFDQMLDAFYGVGSREQCAMPEDLVYAANHVSIARHKAEDAIPSDEHIRATFRSDTE